MFLKIPNKTSILSISAAISEALNYSTLLRFLQNSLSNSGENAQPIGWAFLAVEA
jgi:hypothetical protein